MPVGSSERLDIFDRRWWNEEERLYEGLGMGNVGLLPPLAVLGLEGDAAAVKKIVGIMERMNQPPPWDMEEAGPDGQNACGSMSR